MKDTDKYLIEAITGAAIMVTDLPGRPSTTGRVTPIRVYAIRTNTGATIVRDITRLVAVTLGYRYNSNKNYFTLSGCGYCKIHAVTNRIVTFSEKLGYRYPSFVTPV